MILNRAFWRLAAASGLVLALASGSAVAGSGEIERGTWHWTGSRGDHAYGSAQVVGNPAKEAEVLDIFKRWKITRVYVAHLPARFRTEADVIANWNARLQQNGQKPFLLLSTTNWIFEGERERLRKTLDELLLDFNRSRENGAERFQGVHFDVEPHILSQWKTATPEGRRELLLLLRDMFADAKAHLVANGAGDLPIFAALPVWIDGLPPELGGSSRIGWKSVAERDEWFREMGKNVSAMSLMAFETPYVRSILNNAAWEREHFAGDVIIALRADLGNEWQAIDEMLKAAGEVESATGEGIDIQPFRYFAERAGARSPEEFGMR